MRVLVTGASGQLGPYLLGEVRRRGHEVVAWMGRGGVDLRNTVAVERAFETAKPEAVIHAAAMSKPAEAVNHPEAARAVNVEATATLANLAEHAGARFVLLSTDMVFDGERGGYTEDDPPSPVSIYGRTKAEAERRVLGRRGAAVVRLSLLYGRSMNGTPTLLDQQIDALRSGRSIRVFTDEWRTPLSLDDAAAGLVTLSERGAEGLWHLGGPERLSRSEFAERLAEALGVSKGLLERVSRLSIESREPRPRDTSMSTAKWEAAFGSVGAGVAGRLVFSR